MFHRVGHTTTVGYDEVRLGRWVEDTVRAHGIRVLTGAAIVGVERDGGRIVSVLFATRYGPVEVAAGGFVDASGDAALAWAAGLQCRLPEREIYGSQQLVVENLDENHRPDPGELAERVGAKAAEYGLTRHDGLAFFFPGRGTAVLNMTHIEAPLDPIAAAAGADRGQGPGRPGGDVPAHRVPGGVRQGHRALLRPARPAPDPLGAGGAPADRGRGPRRRPLPGRGGAHGVADRAARQPEGYVWETFGPEHVHYVPLRSMTPPDVDNLLAAGRCVDGDAAALSSVRVMGPCGAMGMAAAHALDLAGKDSVHDIDHGELAGRLAPNLEN